MTEEQLEKAVQRDFDTLAGRLGADILNGLATNYPHRFSQWLIDMKFGSAARYVMSFQAQLQPIDEAKADLILGADTIADADGGVH